MTAVFSLVVRSQLTRGRAIALGSVGALGILLGYAVGQSNEIDRPEAAFDFIEGFGLGLLVPAVTLVFASAAFGDPVEDRTLVYLWLRPIARWRLAIAALAASWTITLPFAVGPILIAAALTGEGSDLIGATVAAGVIAVAAYGALFLGFGLVVRRALAWGIAYVLIWEGFVARSGIGPSRLSILVYARSLLADISGQPAPTNAASTPVAIIVPLAVTAAAIALTSWALRRASVA